MKKRKVKLKSQFNIKVVTFSLIALLCIVLGFIIHWMFMVPAVILMIINQKELMKKKED